MSAVQMSPDSAWMVGSTLTALIATGPAYLAAKRGSKKAESTEHAVKEHEVTREAMQNAVTLALGPISGRLDEMHKTLADIQGWQAEHTTEHAVSALRRPLLEVRKGE